MRASWRQSLPVANDLIACILIQCSHALQFRPPNKLLGKATVKSIFEINDLKDSN